MIADEIKTINAAAIGIKCGSDVVDFYIRNSDGLVTITEKKENIVVYLKMLKSVYMHLFELYIGDHQCKKYKIRLPLLNIELIIKELQPLLRELNLNQNLLVS